MILTLKPFGAVEPRVLGKLRAELSEFGEVTVAPASPVPESFLKRKREGAIQYLASEFERACSREPGDRVLAITEEDLYERGLNFVFGHATLHDRYGVISLARLSDGGTDRLMERAVKTAVHEIGHTLGLHHDDANVRCVMHFSERLDDTDLKGREFCARCAPAARLALSRLGT